MDVLSPLRCTRAELLNTYLHIILLYWFSCVNCEVWSVKSHVDQKRREIRDLGVGSLFLCFKKRKQYNLKVMVKLHYYYYLARLFWIFMESCYIMEIKPFLFS